MYEIFPAALIFILLVAASLGALLLYEKMPLHHRQEEIAQIDLTSVASPFPFALGLPQSETERLLGENLSGLGIGVERGVELTGLTQTSDAVRAVLRHSDGREEIVETPWLIG